MSSLPNNFNPSDYEFLIKSLTEGNYITKAESLKRFNTLVTTDKKQFAIYAKRVVLAIQDLMFEPKVHLCDKPGRYQPPRKHIDPVNHQPEPTLDRVLHQKQAPETNGQESGRLEATNSQDISLLPHGLCQDLQVLLGVVPSLPHSGN